MFSTLQVKSQGLSGPVCLACDLQEVSLWCFPCAFFSSFSITTLFLEALFSLSVAQESGRAYPLGVSLRQSFPWRVGHKKVFHWIIFPFPLPEAGADLRRIYTMRTWWGAFHNNLGSTLDCRPRSFSLSR